MGMDHSAKRVAGVLGLGLIGIGVGTCARPIADAGRSVSASPRTDSVELVGRWEGSYHAVAVGDKFLEGRATLEVADDRTFTLTETRPGGGSARESGTVVMNGEKVTLQTSTGAWIMLDRRGNVLHGLTVDRGSGYPVHIAVERQPVDATER